MGTISFEYFKMKTAILVLFISLTIFAIGESCLVVNCSGVTAATCTSPCYQCGACKQNCCQRVFFGRTDKQGEDRTFQIACASGREEKDDNTEALKDLEKKAFQVCDEDQDGGLTWDEVSQYEDAYGQFINLDSLPDENDFKDFDADEDGVLFYEEWEKQVDE